MGGWSDGLLGQSEEARKSVSVRKGILSILARIGFTCGCGRGGKSAGVRGLGGGSWRVGRRPVFAARGCPSAGRCARSPPSAHQNTSRGVGRQLRAFKATFRTRTHPVSVLPILGRDAQQPFGADDQAGLAVLDGAAAPRDELRPEQRVSTRPERLRRYPVEATVRADGPDVHLLGHVEVRLDDREHRRVVMDG
eukprot:scaffold374_cov108-Isochrysis_galbana.AAC.5